MTVPRAQCAESSPTGTLRAWPFERQLGHSPTNCEALPRILRSAIQLWYALGARHPPHTAYIDRRTRQHITGFAGTTSIKIT